MRKFYRIPTPTYTRRGGASSVPVALFGLSGLGNFSIPPPVQRLKLTHRSRGNLCVPVCRISEWSYPIRFAVYCWKVASARDDPTLSEGPAGLNVLGRGGKHQIDTIADLRIDQPFSNPQRLLVEAKAYSEDRIGEPCPSEAFPAICLPFQ